MTLPIYMPQAQQSIAADIQQGHVFGKPVTLHAGWWELHIEKGDAWIFCRRGNFPLKASQSMNFEPSDGDILIRRLYVKSIVKFRATKRA